jgi:hypothetical protein
MVEFAATLKAFVHTILMPKILIQKRLKGNKVNRFVYQIIATRL